MVNSDFTEIYKNVTLPIHIQVPLPTDTVTNSMHKTLHPLNLGSLHSNFSLPIILFFL